MLVVNAGLVAVGGGDVSERGMVRRGKGAGISDIRKGEMANPPQGAGRVMGMVSEPRSLPVAVMAQMRKRAVAPGLARPVRVRNWWGPAAGVVAREISSSVE